MGKAKTVVGKYFVIAGNKKEAQAERRASISNIFRTHSYALDGVAVAQEMLKSAGEFDADIIGQLGIALGGKQRKRDQDAKLCLSIDQIVRDIRKSENAVVDRRLQKLLDDTEDLHAFLATKGTSC